MVRLLGFLSLVPKQVLIAIFAFAVGFGYGVYDNNEEKLEAQIEYLNQTVNEKEARIENLAKTLATVDDEQSSLNERVKRLQSTNANLQAKLSDNTKRIDDGRCRALLSECINLNARSASLQQEGVGLVKECERKLKAVQQLNTKHTPQ